MTERFLVTGALGCIGAWTLRLLRDEGVPVVAFDLGTDDRRLRLVLPEDLGGVTLVTGDVTDLAALERTIAEHGITHVVHLAALLIPQIKADPARGASVNVVGTTNVFEAARRGGVRGVAYASSAAVYGADDNGGAEDARRPATLYGVFKLANEATARIYWEDHELRSVGLRPYVVYGPGRDQGLTADPTLAMEAAARGEPYRIGFGGRSQLHYAPDAARTFIAAARADAEGAPAFNLGGPVSHVADVVAAIEAAAPEAAGTISFDDTPLPFPEELDAGELENTIGYAPSTPLAEGVRETVRVFREYRPTPWPRRS
jgi:nucleoside-diphosphate-sugar epimerase